MNAPTDTRARGRPRAQLLLLAGIFAAVTAVLAAGYFLFLRADYVVLAQNLRPADASLVVAELDKRGAAYRLRDGGGTILVPEDQADATRVAIAGSDAAAHGQIGFELFNKSDMGLTNFAQKINYQRALQGELMRTIAMMDGVESARVHLALPERALFRGDRSPPRAAVTVAMKPGQTADPSRVAGIQRLVAAAVPDLPETGVVVLDASGRVISPSAPATAAEDRPPTSRNATRSRATSAPAPAAPSSSGSPVSSSHCARSSCRPAPRPERRPRRPPEAGRPRAMRSSAISASAWCSSPKRRSLRRTRRRRARRCCTRSGPRARAATASSSRPVPSIPWRRLPRPRPPRCRRRPTPPSRPPPRPRLRRGRNGRDTGPGRCSRSASCRSAGGCCGRAARC
ncbi:MAG: flagellar basal-body MS-ring/collar protein FliF [Sphingomonas sp.]